MDVKLTSKLQMIYDQLNVFVSEYNLALKIRSSNGFIVLCRDLDPHIFYYAIYEKKGELYIHACFCRSLINIAPKFYKLMNQMAQDLSIGFSRKKNLYLIGEKLISAEIFIKRTITYAKEIIRIMGYYYAPTNYDDMISQKINIKINSKSMINYRSFVIGRNTIINGAFQSKCGKVFLGQFIAGGYNIRFIAGNHLIQLPNLQIALQRKIDGGTRKTYLDKGFIDIGNNVWIGDNTVFLKNVTVGDGAVIGSGSVVTHDVPPFAIVAGVPAKIIKYRYKQNVIDQLMKIQWWNWPMEKILSEKKFFATEIPSDEDFDVYSLLN